VNVSGRIPSDALLVNGTMTSAVLDLFGNHVDELAKLKGKTLDITIKEHRDRRSTRANALCWELCSQIGKAITPPIAKEDVYRDAVRAVGEFDQYMIKEEALDAFMETRKLLGVGWFAEVIGDSPLRGWVEVFAYRGSSTYDTKSMSRLIDYLIDQAQQMELQIAYDLQEIEQIKEAWRGEHRL